MLSGLPFGEGGLGWRRIAGRFWIGDMEPPSDLGCCDWVVPFEWRFKGSVAVWTPGPIDSDVSRGSSGEIGEVRMVSAESAERGGGARDVKGGE
jgi:hypothetical protein